MGGIGDAIKYLYDKFILRDVLSFITPGAIVVLAATHLFFPEVCYYHYHIPWPFYIVIFGVFFVAGFAVQCLGEIIGFIRFTPYPENNWRRRGRIFCCNWRKDYDKADSKETNIWFWEEHRKSNEFFEAINRDTMNNQDVRLGRERLVALQQMCGNGFIAILIAVILFSISLCPATWVKILLASLVALLLLLALFWGFRVTLLRKYVRECLVIERHREERNKKEESPRET